MKNNKILSLLGLMMKSGSLTSGESLTEAAIREKKALLVIVANDASANTKKLFTNQCNTKNIPLYFYSDKDSLGHAIGKPYRASIAVLDKGFCEAIKKQLDLLN